MIEKDLHRLGFMLVLTSASLALGAEPGILSPDSPLASSDSVLFAVGRDGTQLLARTLSGGQWQQVTNKKFGAIGGLAVQDQFVYLSDSAANSIFRVSYRSGEVETVHTGAPFSQIGEVAIYYDHLYIADSIDGLHEMDLVTHSIAPVDLGLPPFGRIHLAASNLILVISVPSSGLLMSLARHSDGPPILTRYLCAGCTTQVKSRNGKEMLPDVLPTD